MSLFREKPDGQLSTMRVMGFILLFAGIAILVFCIYMAFKNEQNDIGTNLAFLIGSMFTLVMTGKIIHKKIENGNSH